ncbi:uncharacterized protein A4U43_C03F16720 [Asparagus officinalis]|uniref:J domain-containing protein n=2 Tax=Asparagus officinalis TaxID=4686 RepID=A0A5P1FAL6_ASPOF|nr:uncharacterized protein A4U43_C03F16720 [Asparagus officinalis]
MKRYSVPLVLFAVGLFFQLVVLPNSYPPSHYDVLGIKPYSSIEDVTEAYEKLSSRWVSGSETPSAIAFIKVRYAFELLTNPLWKRDYDIFGIDEQLWVVEKVKEANDGLKFSDIQLPLLQASSSDKTIQPVNMVTSENFISKLGKSRTMLIQVYSDGSPRCIKFISTWKMIANLLDEVVDTGMVELGDVQLASFFAERKRTQQPFFRNGVPALVAFPPNCVSSNCFVRYQGDHTVDAVIDWMATDILGLPRILYYTKETLVSKFFAESGYHKVKVICFSKNGERAVPFMRQAARDYWAYASFSMVLWREEDSSFWWNMFNVESAPSIVILKDPGVQPFVHHGNLNRSQFLKIMENNKHQELPQLRSVTSMELGCDANGYSRAGNNTVSWYCVVLAGRLSVELNKMRETMRKAKQILAGNVDSDIPEATVSASAAGVALKENRLTFTWLDGETQKKYCLFYLYSENIQETCGPRGYVLTEVPRLFIVRYKRNSTEREAMAKRKKNNVWSIYQEEDTNVASQLVARYNGSQDVQEIIQWVSHIIEDGDTRELPYFVDNTPELIPEDANPMWTKRARNVFSAGKGLKHRVQGFISALSEYMKDPRLGPVFLLGACLSFGTIWVQNSQPTQPTQTNDGTEKKRSRKAERSNHRRPSNVEKPSSITDEVPKDAYQMLPSDSDSE